MNALLVLHFVNDASFYSLLVVIIALAGLFVVAAAIHGPEALGVLWYVWRLRWYLGIALALFVLTELAIRTAWVFA